MMISLQTDRLIVRQPALVDAVAVADYYARNRDFHERWDPTRPDGFFTAAYWEKQMTSLLEENDSGHRLDLFIFTKDNRKRVIGKITFSGIVRGPFQACLLGYSIDESEEGKGLMTEALRVAIGHIFSVQNMHRIMANYIASNTRSARLLEQLGFQIEGVAKEYLRINGRWQDHVLTSLTNSNWIED